MRTKLLYWIAVFSFFCLMLNTIYCADTTTTSVAIPYNSNLQGLCLENISNPNTVLFYMGFDEGNSGTIKTYRLNSRSSLLEEINSISLPTPYNHTNDLQIVGDSLLVTCWNNTKISNVIWIDKSTGKIKSVVSDTLEDGWHLQFSYMFHDTLYLGITNAVEVRILKHSGNKKLLDVAKLNPKFYKDINYIQGTKVISNDILAVLTSYPTRIDLYDINDNYRYLKSVYGEYNNCEAEGLGVTDEPDKLAIYYLLTPPNRMNILTINRSIKTRSENILRSPDSMLWQNYPNPFNSSTLIRYDVYESGFVTLKVYNALGAEVATLVNEIKQKGNYKVELNSDKTHLNSGVYFYRLISGMHSEDRKMTILK